MACRWSWILVVTAVMILGAPRCDKPGGSAGGPGAPSAHPVDATPPEPPRDAAPEALPKPPPQKAGPVSSGPTGLVECDRALELVCRCAKEQASLRQPCKTLSADAPGWKKRAGAEEPDKIDDLRQACLRILQSVEAAYSCK